MGQCYPKSGTKWGKPKGGNPTDGKGKGESVRYAFLEISGNGPIAEEVSGNQVDVSTRQVNMSDIPGEGAWGNKNWPDGRSIIIDAGFNGGRLRSSSRLRTYMEYLMSFHKNENIATTNEKSLIFAHEGRRGRDSTIGTAMPILAQWNSKPAPVMLIRGKAELRPEWILLLGN